MGDREEATCGWEMHRAMGDAYPDSDAGDESV
jgi:hypothetical protein